MRTARVLSPLTAVVLVVAALAPAVPAAAGIHYRSVTTSEVVGQGSSHTLRVEGWVDGAKAKIEFRESDNPTMPAGAYLLTQDGGRTLYFVNPEEKTYAEWNLDAMLRAVGGMMQAMGPLLRFEVSDPRVEMLAQEPGGTVAGLPTTHARYRTTYAMKVRVLGMGQASSVDRVQDIWSTDALDDVALGVWLRNRPSSTGNPELDKLMAAEMEKLRGFPLKTVEVTTTTGRKGKRESESRTVMEVTSLDRDAATPAATFELPADYRQTEMAPVAGAAGQGEEGDPDANPFKKIFGGG